MNKPEILAPAGSWDSMTAAVYCGADAVYLGGKSLNARRNAGNFDDEELARAISFCHVNGVKVYQTINTVIFDDEIPELVIAAKTAAELGIDAAIVQDFGVLRFLRESVPDLPIIASTQMAVHNLAGALEAESLGCSVIVLARELSCGEIAHISHSLKTAKTEVFLHGALCMSVSGQCYLSAMLGARSGNRGLCAQPCRLPFSAGNVTHALSLKDLSLMERTAELRDAGVASLKIEGRMKRPEYVAAAVTAARAALDGKEPDMETLRSVFSRNGFTSGYFDGKRDRFMFGIRQKEDVTAAKDVLGELSRIAARQTQRVPLKGEFVAVKGKQARFFAEDFCGHSAEVFGTVPEEARTKPTDEARARQSLEKTGGTPFYWQSLNVSVAKGLMLPVSQLNAMRRTALEKIELLRGEPNPYKFINPLPLSLPHPKFSEKPRIRVRCNKSQLTQELTAVCDKLIIPFDAVDTALAMDVPPEKIIVEIPRIVFEGEDKIPEYLASVISHGITAAWCGNIGAVRMARDAGMNICGGWSLNITNSHALLFAKEWGFADAELSFEIGRGRLRVIDSALPFGIIAYGYLPLMVYRNCPMRAAVGCEACRGHGELCDRTGTKFRTSCRDGVTELFNSVPLYLADRLKELPAHFYTLWFTRETPQQCSTIAAQYAGNLPANPPDNLTRGLYYRQVL